MASATNFLENRIVDWLLRGQAFTPPSTVYVALFTSPTTEAGGGTEVSGGGYARVAVPCTLAAWSGTQGPNTTTPSSGTGGQTSNNNAITFPVATAPWGTVTHVALYNAATGGNMLLHGPLSPAVTIQQSEQLIIPAGQLTVTVA